jgi:transcriptional regulator with XRE-family HTH domain
MKRARKSVVVHDPLGLAEALGLTSEDAMAMEFRARLNVKIVKSKAITHAALAKRAGASRTRITAILNGQTAGVSTDFLLRVLYALGCRTVPTFSKTKSAA